MRASPCSRRHRSPALATPHSGSGSYSRGYNFDASSILDVSAKVPSIPSKSLSRSEKAVCGPPGDKHRKINPLAHLPHVSHMWKSPFRREVPKGNDNDESESNSDEVYENDSDVVVPPCAREDVMTTQLNDTKHKKRRKNIMQRESRTFPRTEIGGRDTVPSLCLSQVSREESVGIVNEVAYLYSTTPEQKDEKRGNQ